MQDSNKQLELSILIDFMVTLKSTRNSISKQIYFLIK